MIEVELITNNSKRLFNIDENIIKVYSEGKLISTVKMENRGELNLLRTIIDDNYGAIINNLKIV